MHNRDKSSSEKKRRVARRACLACRDKKVKCDGEVVGPELGSLKCSNCANSGIECIFVASHRGGRRAGRKILDHDQGPVSHHRMLPKHPLGLPGGPFAPPPPPPHMPLPFPFPPHHHRHPFFSSPWDPPHQLPYDRYQHHHRYHHHHHHHRGGRRRGFHSSFHNLTMPLPLADAARNRPAFDVRPVEETRSPHQNLFQEVRGSSPQAGSSSQKFHLPDPPLRNLAPESTEKLVPSLAKIALSSDSLQRPGTLPDESPNLTLPRNSPYHQLGFMINGKFSEKELEECGFPSWNYCLDCFNCFFTYVHPQFKILESPTNFLTNFRPTHNTSLSHAVLLCGAMYLQSDQYNAQLPYQHLVEKYWDELDILALLQTLLIMAFYNIRFSSNREQAEKYLAHAARLVVHSNIPNEYDQQNLEKLILVASLRVKMQKEALLTVVWRLYYTIYETRLFYNDMKLCSELFSPPDDGRSLEEILIPNTLPFCADGLSEFGDVLGCVEQNHLRKTLWKGNEASNTNEFYLRTVQVLNNLVSPQKIPLNVDVAKIERSVNRGLVRFQDGFAVVDFHTLASKVMLLEIRLRLALSGSSKLSSLCAQDIGTSSFAVTFLQGQEEFDILSSGDVTLSKLLELFLIIQDIVELLSFTNFCSDAFSKGFSHPFIKLSSASHAAPGFPENYNPRSQSFRESQPAGKSSNSRQIYGRARESLETNTALRSYHIFWQQLPPLLGKLICQTVPLQVLLLLFSKNSKYVDKDVCPRLVYFDEDRILDNEASTNLKDNMLRCFQFKDIEPEVLNLRHTNIILKSICDNRTMLEKLDLSLDAASHIFDTLDKNGLFQTNIQHCKDWTKRQFTHIF
ncbi:LADA_0B03840g1_1 [Lachancea dasiensis]|uniref:LADA_0B03840g1_1 n=1 Tax=Lachancea dasiensis TaxID=1072105 RepID=A0A1G4IT86_9SACH|nr:LADA_0B03840g1_1 [Lachancea dasiensis]